LISGSAPLVKLTWLEYGASPRGKEGVHEIKKAIGLLSAAYVGYFLFD
jgi:hypothetical protein